jgi:hypothetical protein
MSSLFRSFSVGITAAVFASAAGAQPLQSLKDVWLATGDQLLALTETQLELKDVDLQAPPPREFKALAFERPALGTSALEVRGLIAVDDTEVWRFETNTADVPPRLLFDAAASPGPALRFVTAVAVTDEDRIVISGYSRPKRVFEIWEAELQASGPPIFRQGASSTPQLTDAVYVRPEDVTGGLLAGGGLLATAGKQVLFFPKGNSPSTRFTTTLVLADGKSLALKGSTELTSVDLLKRTGMLMIATTDRTLLTRAADLPRAAVSANSFATVGLPSAPVPGLSNCQTLRTQRLIVRNAQGGDDTSTFVADSACQQLVRYDVSVGELATQDNAADGDVTWDEAPLVALAVGEGNTVVCEPSQSPTDFCELISGDAFRARIDTDATSQLLVLQFPDLCDIRVNPACPVSSPVDPVDGKLSVYDLLPPAVQSALGEAEITLPPYLFAARGDGRFGVVFVQADDAAANAGATIELDIQKLVDPSLTGPDYELGVAVGLPRLPLADPIRVLNQDVAAYAPDNQYLATVRGFEATPITVGVRNPMLGALRGFSAIIYGLQHDVYPASQRNTVGIPIGATLGGLTPGADCDLELGGQSFFPDERATQQYFFNLVACLFRDEELLLTQVIPGDYAALETALNQVKDKLIKALSGAGPNTGAETFQAVLTQLDQFDAEVAATPFTGIEIYQNELLVRSKVLRFNLVERALPSIPIGGFVD